VDEILKIREKYISIYNKINNCQNYSDNKKIPYDLITNLLEIKKSLEKYSELYNFEVFSKNEEDIIPYYKHKNNYYLGDYYDTQYIPCLYQFSDTDKKIVSSIPKDFENICRQFKENYNNNSCIHYFIQMKNQISKFKLKESKISKNNPLNFINIITINSTNDLNKIVISTDNSSIEFQNKKYFFHRNKINNNTYECNLNINLGNEEEICFYPIIEFNDLKSKLPSIEVDQHELNIPSLSFGKSELSYEKFLNQLIDFKNLL
jgi:hypothetical protein